MNMPTDLISYMSLALLPAYLIYLLCTSSTIEHKYARLVVRNQQYFNKSRAKMRAWRVSFLYETYKDDFALAPKMHFCVEVNMGWLFAPRWKQIMVAPASSTKEMLEKFRKADMGRLPKNLQENDHMYAAGENKAWRVGLFLAAALPFTIEVARAFLVN